ncbi:MAG: hypothetical protein J4G06_10655 [Caldilineaceae bacterium]|nr:hypothetical protein [Caldilineaceae bacterium]
MDPNDRQAGLLMQHCGWARTASNWAIDTFAAAWFTGEGEDNEWLTDMDLRPLFNACKADLFPWSCALSQAPAKNAIIHTGQALKNWGAYCQARKAGQPARRVGFPKHRKRGRHMSYTASNGRNTIRPVGKRGMGQHARGAALCRRCRGCHRESVEWSLAGRVHGRYRCTGTGQA